jgi:agmatinase
MAEFDPDAAAPDGAGIYGLPFTPENAKVVVVPVPYEATTSYGGGTSKGPAAVLDEDKMPVTLGGDHSVPYGAIRAYAEKYPKLGILHLDAHADLRDAYEGFTWSHASIFHNVMTKLPIAKLVQAGVRDLGSAENQMIATSNGRIVTFFDSDVAARKENGDSFADIADDIVAELPQHVYLSWDIDGLDPTLCPSTGTPVPGGLSWNEAIGLLRALIRARKRIVGLDLCEVAPGDTEWDANVGARLLYKMIGFALLSQG